MEIDSEEHEAPSDAYFSTLDVQYLDDQDESVVPVDRPSRYLLPYVIILKSDGLDAVLLGHGDLTKWYRTRYALQITERHAGSTDIFRIDRFEIFLMDEDYLCRDQSCTAKMVGSSGSEQLRRHQEHEDT